MRPRRGPTKRGRVLCALQPITGLGGGGRPGRGTRRRISFSLAGRRAPSRSRGGRSLASSGCGAGAAFAARGTSPTGGGDDRRVRLSRSTPSERDGGGVRPCLPCPLGAGMVACAAHAHRPHVHCGHRPQVVPAVRPHVLFPARCHSVLRVWFLAILMYLLLMCRGRADRGPENALLFLTRRRAGSGPGGRRRLWCSRRPRPRRKGRGRENRCRACRRGGIRLRRRRGR